MKIKAQVKGIPETTTLTSQKLKIINYDICDYCGKALTKRHYGDEVCGYCEDCEVEKW